jgi:hypothetical protein
MSNQQLEDQRDASSDCAADANNRGKCRCKDCCRSLRQSRAHNRYGRGGRRWRKRRSFSCRIPSFTVERRSNHSFAIDGRRDGRYPSPDADILRINSGRSKRRRAKIEGSASVEGRAVLNGQLRSRSPLPRRRPSESVGRCRFRQGGRPLQDHCFVCLGLRSDATREIPSHLVSSGM